jgi:pSer/pThr/pTyr-binding forkhead associated (FHA) protein
MLTPAMSEYVLEIVEGPEAGKQISLGDGSIEIGREAGVGIELANDDLVSRRHVRLTPIPSGVAVEDLGSRNGTFVNGDEIFSPAMLGPGGQLTVGVTVFELRTTGQAAASTAVRPVPVALTDLRPLPTARPAVAAEPSAPARGLAREERAPDYVPGDLVSATGRDSPLSGLLDVHTKHKARTAPLAVFVLVAFVVIIALALR